MTDLFKKLTRIQNELKAPKSQKNTFGNYSYRNCEDILEAVKPLLLAENVSLKISDEVVLIGDRFYIKATASLESENQFLNNTAFARECDHKKGMDDAQLTGATSSYARKYALNGLFLIDDTKDADSMDNSAQTGEPEKAWYNDFDSHKEMMIAKIKSGESTAKDILKNLRVKFKVSKEIANKIEGLK